MIKYTTIDRIFAKLQRDYGYSNLDEANVIEWVGEALAAINAIPNQEQVVKFFSIKNYQIELPVELTSIIQIIKLNNSIGSLCNCINELRKEEDIVVYNTTNTLEPLSLPITPKTLGNSIFSNLSALWYTYYNFEFDVVRLSTSNYARAYDCTKSVYGSCDYEYTVINGNYVRFNFTDAEIALSYNRIPLDENGYPLIPDTYAYSTAITKYIIYKISERRFYEGEQNANQKYQKAEQDWNKYCSQAASESMIPNSLDDMENLAQMWLKPIQARNYYTLNSTLGKSHKLKH